MTAETTRIVGRALTDSTRQARRRSDIHPEELLPHEQHVPAGERALLPQAHEGAVRAPDVGQVDATIGALGDPAMEARDVSVVGEQNVSPLATAVHASLRHRVGVARRVATDHEREPTDVSLARAAEALDAIRRFALTAELLEPDDLLTDAEGVPELEHVRLVRLQLEVHAVQRALVLDEDLAAPTHEGRVARRQIAVA